MDETRDVSQAARLCRHHGIRVLPKNARRKRGETNSVNRIQTLIDKHGRRHVWVVLYVLMESKTGQMHLTSPFIGALSDLLMAYPAWAGRRDELAAALGKLDLDGFEDLAREAVGIDGRPPMKRILIAGYLQAALRPVMEQRRIEHQARLEVA